MVTRIDSTVTLDDVLNFPPVELATEGFTELCDKTFPSGTDQAPVSAPLGSAASAHFFNRERFNSHGPHGPGSVLPVVWLDDNKRRRLLALAADSTKETYPEWDGQITPRFLKNVQNSYSNSTGRCFQFPPARAKQVYTICQATSVVDIS